MLEKSYTCELCTSKRGVTIIHLHVKFTSPQLDKASPGNQPSIQMHTVKKTSFIFAFCSFCRKEAQHVTM